MEYKDLWITSLNEEQHARTCGYWYTITALGMAHTAFRTRKNALTWLNALGLTINGELPEKGNYACLKILGSYLRELVDCKAETFKNIPGIPVAVLENARYMPGKIGEEPGGRRQLYVVNVNADWAEEYPHRLCRKMEDAGLMVL